MMKRLDAIEDEDYVSRRDMTLAIASVRNQILTYVDSRFRDLEELIRSRRD